MKLLNVLKDFSLAVKNRFNHNNNGNHRLSGSENPFDGENSKETFFGGMGLVTATEIVKERIDENIINEYGIDELKNTGRYYIARVSEANGSISHSLLVDKQNGMVRSLSRKPTK